MQQWTPQMVNGYRANAPTSLQILDVREPWEYDIAHIEGSTLIPLGKLLQNMEQLDQTRPILVVCHHGIRSAYACQLLERHGFQTINLAGGIERWAREIDHTMPLY